MESSKKIARGVVWTTIANIVNGIYGFITVPILIGYFGKTSYGLIGLAMSINVYLRLMDIGLSSTNVRFFSNWLTKGEQGKVNKLFQSSLSFYGIIGLINALVLVVISFFSQQIFNLSPDQDIIIKHLLYILAISAFISWFTSCFDQFIRANEYVGWTQIMSLLPKFVQIVILILTVTIGFTIEVYYALTTFAMFIIIPLLIKKIRKICPFIIFKLGIDKAIFKEILPYTLNIFSFGIFQFSVINLRPVFLGMRGTIESVADFRILNGIVSVVIMLGGAFLGVILPSASKIVANNNRHAYERVAYDGTKYITIALCFCCFGVMSVSSELIQLYVGADYLYLVPWLNFWLLTTLSTHNQAISSLILSGSDIRAITFITIVSSIIGLTTCWITIPALQIGGTVLGYGVYLVIQLLFYYIYYWPKKMGINSMRVFLQSFVPFVLLGVLCYFISSKCNLSDSLWLSFIIKGFIFFLVFVIGVTFIIGRSGISDLRAMFKRS